MKSISPLGKLGASFRGVYPEQRRRAQDDRPQGGQSEPRPRGSGPDTWFHELSFGVRLLIPRLRSGHGSGQACAARRTEGPLDRRQALIIAP